MRQGFIVEDALTVNGRTIGENCKDAITWRPPELLVLAWQLNADWQFDPALVTEVEVRFVAMSERLTRVELEHRHLERMGPKALEAHAAIDSPSGWGGILELYGRHADS